MCFPCLFGLLAGTCCFAAWESEYDANRERRERDYYRNTTRTIIVLKAVHNEIPRYTVPYVIHTAGHEPSNAASSGVSHGIVPAVNSLPEGCIIAESEHKSPIITV